MHDRSDFEILDNAGRTIALAPGLPAIPERLLLAHARGDVLFLCGAGASIPAGLPDFRQLVLDVYRTLDPSVYEILTKATNETGSPPKPDCSTLTDRQAADRAQFCCAVNRFMAGRTIALAPGLPAIPERLLLAHARGDVLFLCGAGASIPAGLPDFRQLVLDVYRTLDPSVYQILTKATNETDSPPKPDCSTLTDRQAAEVNRFIAGEFDVVLGMLERRLDSHTREDSKVRSRVVEILRSPTGKPNPATSTFEAGAARSDDADAPRTGRPAPIHRALIRLADRGGA